MQKPGWATFIGIFMLLIGGCGALDNFGDMNADKILEMQSEMMDEIESGKGKADTITLDSISAKQLTMFGDSIVKDSMDNVDVNKTLKSMFKISDYRIEWTKKFAYIGLFISLIFALSGIFYLTRKKYTIQLSIAVLALSLAVGIFQFIIFRADSESSKMVSNIGNFEIYWSIFLDIILLVTIMVLDKSYYNEPEMREDYYDTDPS